MILLSIWMTALSLGAWICLDYEKTPANVSPSSRKIFFARTPASDYCLVMFAHPKCECTKASLSELARFLARNTNTRAKIYFNVPHGFEAWTHEENLRLAESIPGVSVFTDLNGLVAKKFDAKASGECFLFDQKSNLRFHGGITASRGHEGDNFGLECMTHIVEGQKSAASSNVVFGCALFDPEEKSKI